MLEEGTKNENYISQGKTKIGNFIQQKHTSVHKWQQTIGQHINGLVQERRNSIANAMELCLSCTNPSI